MWTVKLHSSQPCTNHLIHNFPHALLSDQSLLGTVTHPYTLFFVLFFLPELVFFLPHSLSPSHWIDLELDDSACNEDVFLLPQRQMGSELIQAVPSTHVELVLEVSDKTEVRHLPLLNYDQSSSLMWGEAPPPKKKICLTSFCHVCVSFYLSSFVSGGSRESQRPRNSSGLQRTLGEMPMNHLPTSTGIKEFFGVWQSVFPQANI